MNDSVILSLLIGNFALLFICYVITLKSLRHLNEKQQSTIYGVSHVWGSIKEFREEFALKSFMADLPLPPLPEPIPTSNDDGGVEHE